MGNQNTHMKVTAEGSKQVITNMYDPLNVYQITMFVPIKEVSSPSSLPVGWQMGSAVPGDQEIQNETQLKLNEAGYLPTSKFSN